MDAPGPRASAPSPESDAARVERARRAEQLFAQQLAQALEPAQLAQALGRLRGEVPELRVELDELARGWARAQSAIASLRSDPVAVDSTLRELGLAHEPSDPRFESDLRLRAERSSPSARYRRLERIARGGTSDVLRVWDRALERPLAMKVLRREPAAAHGPPSFGRRLRRFLAEVRVMASLDHPGVVPIYDLGIDREGAPYFTMGLVEGHSLQALLEDERSGGTALGIGRALSILLRACETIAYAHSKRVVHRDLKPANVMVGRFGEVYVMDWGFASAQSSSSTSDLLLREPAQGGAAKTSDAFQHAEHADAPPERAPQSARPDVDHEAAGADTAPEVLGTPCYMAPEQARGETCDAAADIYSLGAILYELCAGEPPYLARGEAPSVGELWQRVLSGPPRPLDARVSRDLAAVCARAMAREPQQRYASALELAEDLRALIDGRVAAASERRWLLRAGKWIRRNKRIALLCACALACALGALAFALRWRASQSELRLYEDLHELELLQERAGTLWPDGAQPVAPMHAWIAHAEQLAARLELQRAQLAVETLSAAGAPPNDGAALARAARVKQVETALALLEAPASERGSIADLRARARSAEELAQRCDSAWLARWEHARAAIADPRAHPRYAGLALSIQPGLDPLGPDPRSGLWEFAHMQSGRSPRRASHGELVLEEDSAIVLVLVPGGRTRLGALPARAGESGGAHVDPHARGNEAPLREVELAPFFLSKYELTQAQWLRAEGENPSNWSQGDYARGLAISALHPVEQVTWRDAREVLARLRLELPTEAQWEHAARADTHGPWSFGSSELGAIGRVNATGWQLERAPAPGLRPVRHDDGYEVHAPVDVFEPNPNGLHHVHGNVWEWCRDAYWSNLRFELRPGDGLHLAPDENLRVLRGGSWCDGPHVSRSSFRNDAAPDYQSPCVGVRPARRVLGSS